MPLTPKAQELRAAINKSMGAGTVVLGSEMVVKDRFTTGSLSFDVALGGGLPADQWVEIVGRESAGKTAFVLKVIAANQRLDPDYTVFWLASERFDTDQALALGVDIDRVLVAPTQDMGEAFTLLLASTGSQAATCIVLDSYPALLPEDEDEKGMDDATVAVGARMFNKWIRKAGKASRRDPLGTEQRFHGLIINQYRDKIGGFASFGGPPQTSPGGNGKNYFFYARIEVHRDEYITEKRPGIDKPVKVGQTIRMTTLKNKSAAPQQRVYVDFYFRGAPFLGFQRGDYDLGKEYVIQGILFGVIKKTGGSWLEFEGVRVNGKAAMEAEVRSDIDLKKRLRAAVLEAAGNPLMVDQIQPQQQQEAAAPVEPRARRVRRNERSLAKV